MTAPHDLFRWETLRDVGPHELPFRTPVAGRIMEAELDEWRGIWIRVWRADDGKKYFCHGLTFGGTAAPDGPVSPFSGSPVLTILAKRFERVIPEIAAQSDDIAVWHDLGMSETLHSAVLRKPVVIEGQPLLDYSSIFVTKNGMAAEAETTLEALVNQYGETYTVYTRRRSQADMTGGSST